MKRLALLALCAMLCACAARGPVTPPAAPSSFADRMAALELLGEWTLQGRLALKGARDSGSGSVQWWQGKEGFDLRLHGAFGRGALRLTENTAGARLERADEAPVEASSAAVLLADALPDTPLPLASLRYWVTGRPAPGAVETRQLDADNRLARLRQDGWEIRYLEYQPVPPWVLPSKLQASKGDIELRLAIKRWTPGAHAP
ncbi:MAG: lipoprotein insertase outer membrane protein LolB [Pseudomonadota bacterium]